MNPRKLVIAGVAIAFAVATTLGALLAFTDFIEWFQSLPDGKKAMLPLALVAIGAVFLVIGGFIKTEK